VQNATALLLQNLQCHICGDGDDDDDDDDTKDKQV
jgi:hypothetical protein